ncbi:MAG TPA: hypothetical protein VFL86_21235, partial [Burkholderiaceae bacterium]|nr:hypothetical protein [Burkholderiaceae bacterium]
MISTRGSNQKILVDKNTWGASYFTITVDGQSAGNTFLAASGTSPLGDGSPWPPSASGFVGFDLASSTRPALAAGTHTVQILAFGADGRLVAGRNYTINGNDTSTLAEVSGSAGAVYPGSAGLAWAENTRNAAGTLTQAQLRWDLGNAPASGTLRWRPAGSLQGWTAASFSNNRLTVGTGGLGLADGSYEFVLDTASGLRKGVFTLSGGAVMVPDGQRFLQPVSFTAETLSVTGPADAQGRGRVRLEVGGVVLEAATNVSGQAVFDLAAVRQARNLDRWAVVDLTYNYNGYIQYPNGTRQVTHSERGTLSLNPRFDTATSVALGSNGGNGAGSTDGVIEYRPEARVVVPGARGSLTFGTSGNSVTLPVDGSDWRVQRSGNDLVLDLGAWKPAWGAAEQSVSWQYTGTDGLVAAGNFGVAYDGTVRTVGSVTQRTRQPVLPLTIPGAVTLQAFLVGANGAVPTQVPSGEITGTGPNFTWNASGHLGQTLRYEYTALDSAGQVVSRGRGTLDVKVNGSIEHTPDAPLRTPALLRLAPPAGTTGLVVEARRAGTSDAFVTLPVQAQEGNTRVYSVEGYVPGSGTTTLEYRFTASGSAGVLSKGTGQLSIQANGSTSGSAIEEYRPVIVSFKIVGRNVPQAQLAVPGVGNVTLPGTWVPPVAPSDKSPGELGYTRFDWDAASYGAASGVRTYDYTLTAQSSGSATLQDELGRPLVQTGRIALDPTSARPVQLLQQILTFTQDSEIVVSRSQSYNAFGEVVEERDDRVAERMQAMLGRALTADEQAAARTTLRYNTLGKLVAKIDPQTSITLANGYSYRDRPTTSYGYDLLGRLATQTDANGNLTRQALLAGSQPGQERVAAQWHADGGVRSTAYDIFGDARRITDEENHVIQQGYDKLGRLVQVDRLGIQRVDGSGNAQAAATLGERYSYDQLGQRLTRTDALGQVMRTDYDGLGRITSTRTANGFETRYQYQVATVTGLNGTTAAGYKKTTYEADGRSSIDQIDYFGHTTWHRDLGGTEYTYNYDAAARLVRQTSTVHTGQSKGQDIRYTYYANGYIQSATDVSAGTRSEYGYDAAGNRVSEGYYQWDGSARIASYQNATITYDELNRVARVQDVNYFDIRYEYDAVGNRRLVDSVYWDGVAG